MRPALAHPRLGRYTAFFRTARVCSADADALQKTRAGTRAITLSVPTRYIHTVTETINKKDAKAAVDLLSAWLSV